MEGRILRGEWQPPEQSKIMFGGYATHWVADRRLEPRSRELYAMLLRLHIMPWFGDLALDRITPPMVRLWRTDLLRQGRSETTAAKSYRLLRAILNTAVKDDRLLRENPCRMRGFDKEPTSERPTASVDQVCPTSNSENETGYVGRSCRRSEALQAHRRFGWVSFPAAKIIRSR